MTFPRHYFIGLKYYEFSNICHTVIYGGKKNLFCGPPWIFGIHNFGGGEITIAHFFAPMDIYRVN